MELEEVRLTNPFLWFFLFSALQRPNCPKRIKLQKLIELEPPSALTASQLSNTQNCVRFKVLIVLCPKCVIKLLSPIKVPHLKCQSTIVKMSGYTAKPSLIEL